MNETKIIVICGPSGSGKNTLISALLDDPKYDFQKIVTFTSRPNTRGEVEGKDYYFIGSNEFEEKIKQGFFLEHERTHNYYYGTPKNAFSRLGNYLAHLDIRGGISIRNAHRKSLIIFINTPIKQIINRLQNRSESDAEIKIRLKTAERELKMMDEADVVIDNLDGQIYEAYANLKIAIDKFLSIK